MKILKTDSPVEQKVQQVEKLMNELGLKLQYNYHGLEIEHGDRSYPLVDTESQSESQTEFPRFCRVSD